MASRAEFKQRINSIDSIRKITKAMELVATAKLRRTKKKLDETKEYYLTTYAILQKAFSKITKVELKTLPIPLFKDSTDKKIFILVGSDLGFCGGFNVNCNKILEKNINKEKDAVFCIGKKAFNFCKNKNYTIIDKVLNVADDIPNSLIRGITNKLTSIYQNKEYDALVVIFTSFVNSVTFEAKMLQILPINKDILLNSEDKPSSVVYTFEPEVMSVIKSAIPFYIGSTIFGSIIESKVSEQASRRTSMENATTNADEIKNKLTIEYNRVRQAKITTEISEIVAGADAL